jgi:hypothetical protein
MIPANHSLIYLLSPFFSYDPSKSLTDLLVHVISAQDYLKPSDNKQWFCPDILDFPLLVTFANKNKLAPHEFISTEEIWNRLL